MKSAWLKIKRAKSFKKELSGVIQAFVSQENVVDVYIEINKRTGTHTVRLSQLLDGPAIAPLVLGDALHNLRTALDHAHCDLVEGVGLPITKYTQFRFYDSRDKLEEDFKRQKIIGVPDVQDFYSGVIKPYRSSNVLASLHELDIADKHRDLIPTFTVTRVSGDFYLVGADGQLFGSWRSNTFDIKDGGGITLCEIPPGTKIVGKKLTPLFGVGFGKNTLFAGMPVIAKLEELTVKVEEAVREMESFLGARKKRQLGPRPS
jgi:hypothetical protein